MITMGLLMVIAIGSVVVGAFGAIDAAVRPFEHWERIGRSKAAWIVVQLLVLIPVIGLAGLVGAGGYLFGIRPQLKAVAEGLPAQ